MTNNELKASILIVDDKPLNIDILRRFLDPEQFSISAVTSGEQALEVTKKLDFDLILLDVAMPNIDGFDTCIALKKSEKTKNIPVIFVTAKTNPEDIKRGFMVGSVDYITKPVHQDVVLVRVKTQLARVRQEILERRLLESKKMAELGNMVASITHEVATPLSNVKLSVDTLQGENDKLRQALDSKTLTSIMLDGHITGTQQGLELSLANVERAIALIASFQHVATGQSTHQTLPFNLADHVSDVILTLGPTLKRLPHSIENNIDSNIEMLSYPGALSQVLINLINNSLAHGFDDSINGCINISATLSDETVTLIYCDNGKGINDKMLAHVFDKYFSSNLGSGNSGLGLAICKELVEQELKGSLDLVSSENHGVTFTLTLPSHLAAK